jgi:hypothetical protein
MARSTDDGLHWTDVGDGIVQSWPPLELPGGSIAALGAQYVMVSSDHGATWVPGTAALPSTPGETATGVLYSSWRKAFYLWRSTCEFGHPVPVPADAVTSFPWPTK